MVHVMASREGTTAATDGVVAEMPVRLTTTLYELLTAIQDVVGPDDDALVVATVQHLLQSGRLTWIGLAGVRLGESP
jgi:hypothetical protein